MFTTSSEHQWQWHLRLPAGRVSNHATLNGYPERS
jgi:hypothetical protein